MAYTDIDKPSDYFNTKLYTGNSSTNAITGVGFQPDWVWIKNRTDASNHALIDNVRGATLSLSSNLTASEGTGITSLDSDGFTISNSFNDYNQSPDNYVAWNWLASNTTASNTDGSITSTVSANTTSGFSIVSYTGNGTNSTVGHGLGVAPKMMIIKNRTDIENWEVYHESLGNGTAIRLNLSDASFSTSGRWNNTSPTSSVFSLGTANAVNGSSDSMIAYCFAEKKGFSKMGAYTGNNNANGPFVYLGFRPAWVLVKDSVSGQHWHLIDSVREPFNDDDASQLSPNSNDSESSVTTNRGTAKIDFLSNGFKINSDGSLLNGTGSFIYMAFAENPFVTSTGIPTTAR